MANTEVSFLYKEARLNLEPAFPGSTIHLTLPSSTGPTFGKGIQPKRTVVHEKYPDQDEDTFARKHLASEASIYFRRKHSYPRCFLWRILDDRKVLEIQSIDFDQDADAQTEAHLTLQLQFPSPIRPFGIAFDEPDDQDALTAFVVTASKELYTLNLHRDFFVREAATEMDIGAWCKIFSPISFRLRDPYRIFAVNDRDLFFSMQDGGIQHLTRKVGEDGSTWSDIAYSQYQWSLRSLVAWKGGNSVKFNNSDLDGSAAAAIVLSPENDYIFTVCLDHVLRVWNANTGKIAIQEDLLRDAELPDKSSQYFIGPSQPMLMQMINIQGGGMDGVEYHLVTYSPKKHQFKFLGIRDPEDMLNGVKDVQSDFAFIPPIDEMMNTTVWNLEEFYVKATHGWRSTEIWIRARSGPSSKIYSLTFNLLDPVGVLTKVWKHHWVSVDSGSLTVEGLKSIPTNPGELDALVPMVHNPSVTEQWLDFLLFPGRFTAATLETALLVYRKGIEQKETPAASNKTPFKERLCAAVSSYVAFSRQNVANIDYEQHGTNLMAQWQMYYGLVRDLHKRRGEVLSLVYDYEQDMSWLILSDYASAIRLGSEVEIMRSNQHPLMTTDPDRWPGPLQATLQDDDSQQIARLLFAAGQFRKGLGSKFKQQFQVVITNEMLQSSLMAIPARIETIEQSCKLCEQVSDEDVAKLEDAIGMDFSELDDSLIRKTLETLTPVEAGRGTAKKQIARYGLRAVSRIAQETLEVTYDVLLDLMVLVIFLHVDVDPEEHSEEFNAADLFNEILLLLKDNAAVSWMSGTPWSHPAPTGASSTTFLKSLSERSRSSGISLPSLSQTVLEGVAGRRTFDFSIPKKAQSEVITYWARMWISEPFRNQGYDQIVVDVMSILLQEKDTDLASDFLRFMGQSNWSTYLNARLCLLKGEYTLAAIYFKKASFKLGKLHGSCTNVLPYTNEFVAIGIFNVDDLDYGNYITPDERDLFSDGLPNYYLHVLSLFEKVKAHAFVADFAKLGLQSLTGDEPEDTKTELLSRLFNASIQTSRFEEAYTALSRFTDKNL